MMKLTVKERDRLSKQAWQEYEFYRFDDIQRAEIAMERILEIYQAEPALEKYFEFLTICGVK